MNETSELEFAIHALQEIYFEKDKELKRNFDRSLSFQDALFDRWERAKKLGFGEGTNIYNSANVFGNVKVGRNVWIGPNALLDGMGDELVIGDNCVISADVHIYTHDTVLRTLSGGNYPIHYQSVKIGDCCHIAPKALIAAGVILGNRCLVAVNSFVNESFPENSIIGGCPAKLIGKVLVHPNNHIELIYSDATSHE